MTVDYREPIYDIAQLGHTELLTPDLEASARFFTEVYGLYRVDETSDSVYLRAGATRSSPPSSSPPPPRQASATSPGGP